VPPIPFKIRHSEFVEIGPPGVTHRLVGITGRQRSSPRIGGQGAQQDAGTSVRRCAHSQV